MSASAYYAWIKQPEDTKKMLENKRLNSKVQQLHDNFKQIYGSRRLADELQKEGFKVGRYKTRTLMNRLGLRVRYPKKFKVTTDSNHNEAISSNLLDRNFDVVAPNKVWTTDITYCQHQSKTDPLRPLNTN